MRAPLPGDLRDSIGKLTVNNVSTATRIMRGLIIVLGGLTIVLLSFWITLTILDTRDKNMIFKPTLEDNIDRPGADYRDFDLPTGSGPQVCQQECLKENRCRAFAYQKRQNAHCWLKDDVPEQRNKTDLVSGVVRP